MNPLDAVTPFRLRSLAPAVLAALLAGCTSTDGLFSGQKVDYGSAAAQTKPLDVPPDLTQLARDTRYQTRSGAVSAAAAASAPAPAATSAARVAPAPTAAAAVVPTVALSTAGDVRIERQGQLRWLVVAKTPEQLWPAVRAFWEANGFRIEVDNPAAGIMETNWSENRAKLPKDAVRNLLGGLLRDFYDTGERDLFRTRIERSVGGSEIYVSHRGAQEVYTSQDRETTDWRARPNDPELEAEMLSRLMLALGGVADTRTAAAPPAATVAAAAPVSATGAAAPAAAASAPAAPARARLLTTPGVAALELDEPFDRAWRQVGLGLDRGGFTVEDRDRASGLYYVRYVDPKTAGQEAPSFWARMFGDASNPQAPVRYRVALKSEGGKTRVSVLTSAGEPDVGENGQRIIGSLLNELR